jgi:hypothetical protein
MATWKKILTKTPVADDLGTGAGAGKVLTAVGGGTAAVGWESTGAGDGDLTAVSSSTANQLTVADGTGPAPALSIVTGAVSNAGTALATGDQIYDHVTTRISGLTGNQGDLTAVSSSTASQLTVSGGDGPTPALSIVTGAVAYN